MTELDFLFKKRTKIVCTLGPSSDSVAVIQEMIRAGMNVARLNFSHGDHADHLRIMNNVREAAKLLGNVPIAILQDLQGPRIRIGNLSNPIEIKKDERVVFTTDDTLHDESKIPVTYSNLHADVRQGNTILIADGSIVLHVREILDRDIICDVQVPGTIESHKGINVPDAQLGVPTITEKDKQDLRFGIENGVDYIALSFVRSVDDILHLRELIQNNVQELGGREFAPNVFAKIECRAAVDQLEKLVHVCDGIMVARGDLGIEIPAEEVPIVQKNAIRFCLREAKPCIVATQMLDSMIHNPAPTRAEVSDVSHAVMDHTDAVMLSGETSIGAYPVEAVSVMMRAAHVAESSPYDDLDLDEVGLDLTETQSATARSAVELVNRTKAVAILVATNEGNAARLLSHYRVEVPVVAFTSSFVTFRQLSLVWGVVPYYLDEDLHDALLRRVHVLLDLGAASEGDRIVIVNSLRGEGVDDIDRVTVREV